jgi:ferrous iron transport protein A
MTALLTLDQLAAGRLATVVALQPPEENPEWHRQLLDLGFLPGESVQVLRRAAPGGDPLAVRVGGSTYALRRAEAASVQVRVNHPKP